MQMLNPIDCGSFYQQRDHRTNLALEQPSSPVPLAVSIAPSWAETIDGQITIYWLSSLIARMGQRYNRLILFLPPEVRSLPSLIPGLTGTLAEVLLSHLKASDPCGPYTVVAELDDQYPVISVGRLQRPNQHMVVEPHGWSAMITTSDVSSASTHRNSGVNPIGAALAAALGATEVYFQFNQNNFAGRQSQVPIWISARHCAVTTSAAEAANWNDDQPLPDSVDMGRWLVVGCGALGGNTLAIVGMAREKLKGVVATVDDDIVDVTNLNRLIESLAAHAQSVKKVELAALSLRDSQVQVETYPELYERLSDNQTLKIEDFDVILTGVDQMATRAFVQSDWPKFLVDGGTRGYTWRVSTIGNRGEDPCLGCIAGKSQRQYSDLESPLRCGGGLPEQQSNILPPAMDSYGFVSFFAAAFMAARALEARLETGGVGQNFTTEAVALNLKSLQHRQDKPSELCLCMCGDPVVKQYRVEKFGEPS